VLQRRQGQIGACSTEQQGLTPQLRIFRHWSRSEACGPAAAAGALLAWAHRLHCHLRGEAAADTHVRLVTHCGAQHSHQLLAQALLDGGLPLPAVRLADSCLCWKLAWQDWSSGAGLVQLQARLGPVAPISRALALDHALALALAVRRGLGSSWQQQLWWGSVSLGRFGRLAGLAAGGALSHQ
jgi:hypothetical protein